MVRLGHTRPCQELAGYFPPTPAAIIVPFEPLTSFKITPLQKDIMRLKTHKFRYIRPKVEDTFLPKTPKRRGTTSSPAYLSKPTGDISSVFPSLSGVQSSPLPPRFADLKKRLVQGHEDHVRDSWHRLLADLRQEIDVIKALGSKVIPELEFKDMHNMDKRTTFRNGLRKRGVGLIRGVVSEQEALGWKELVKRYIQTNPSTKGRSNYCLFHVRAFAFVVRAF